VAGDVEFYEPYGSFLPTPQHSLLILWDEIRVPHKPKKQVNRPTLPIIGIVVHPNLLKLTLSDVAQAHLSTELLKWSSKKTVRFPLHHWQKLCGWINWALNIFPLLRPCLNNVYPKLSGKTHQDQNICLNTSVCTDFQWALLLLEKLPLIHLLCSLMWAPDQADVTILCDACPTGMGFWILSTTAGFYTQSLYNDPPFIFYLEALCVLNALLHASRSPPFRLKVLLYTDNQNTVDIFSLLQCLPDYNRLIKSSVDIWVASDIDLRVLHIPGEENQVANALSRADFMRALQICPSLSLTPFCPDSASLPGPLNPPLELLGGVPT